MTRRVGLTLLLALVWWMRPAPAPAQVLDQNCTASIMNRTVQVQPNGTFSIPNVPVDQGQYRVRIVCKLPDGTTRTFLSTFQNLTPNGHNLVGNLLLGENQVIPLQLDLVAFKTTLATRNETTQISVRGILPNGTPRDLSEASAGTSYSTSNAQIATVSPNGLVTALRRGQVIISARNEGVLGSIVLNVTIPNDADQDGMTDEFERANGLNPSSASDAAVDLDNDGLTNLQEFTQGSNPRAADTDGDGVSDGIEAQRGTGLLNSDSDGDGLSDGQEAARNTNPADPDSDDDNLPDGIEVLLSMNPREADQTTTVEGRVVDAAGSPVQGATALAFGLFPASTNATGAFTLQNVPASLGPIAMLARIIRNNQVLEGVSAATVPVPGGVTNVGTIQLGLNSGTVTGLVTSPLNAPVPGVQITVVSGGDRRVTLTDITGRYRVANLQAGAVSLTAIDPRSGLRARGTGALPQNGQATVDVQLAPSAIVAGTVYGADGVTPVGGGVTVTLSGAAFLSTATDALGRYAFDFVSLSAFTVEASDSSGNRGRSTGVLTESGRTTVTDVSFLSRSAVNGTVTSAGAPVPNATVSLSSGSIFGGTRTVTTDGAGSYSFFDVFVGGVNVAATSPLTSTGGQRSGNLLASGPLTLNIELRATGTLRGQVFRAGGTTPVNGARVDLSIGRFALTNANGEYEFTLVPVVDPGGSYSLNVLDIATGDRGRGSAAVANAGQTTVANVTLQGQTQVTVVVRDGTSALVAGAQVSLSGQGTFGGFFQGVTNADGSLTFPRVFVGGYHVSATNPLTQLQGSANGTAVLGSTASTVVNLQASGGVVGTVFAADGATPVSNISLVLSGPVSRRINNPANGTFAFEGVPTGNYRLDAYDSFGNTRGNATGIVVASQGDEIRRNVVLIGIGTVTGRVTNPDDSPSPGTAVFLQSLATGFGRSFQVFTDVNGNYSVAGVVLGNFSVSASKREGQLQLFGAAQGTLTSDGQTVVADIELSANLIPSTTTLFDSNNFEYNLRENGSLQDATRQFFGGDFASNRGGLLLDILVDGTASRFTGQGFGTSEENGREIAIQQSGVGGLDVTRKTYVPLHGYFSRHLEILTNPGMTPITADVRLSSHSRFIRKVQGGFAFDRGAQVISTSSGDDTISVGGANPDGWVVFDDDEDIDPFTTNNLPAVAFVFDGGNGDDSVEFAEFTSEAPRFGLFVHEWRNVTIAPGASVAFLHFVSQETSRAAAQAAAQRLVLLPPEARAGIGADEFLLVKNFTPSLPAVAPLPALTGAVVGRALASDLVPVPFANLTYRSSHVLFGRTYAFQANGLGDFRLDARFNNGSSIAIPITEDSPEAGDEVALTLQARHPATGLQSLATNGRFVPGFLISTTDVTFTNSGILTGLVRRQGGAVVTSGSIQLSDAGGGGLVSALSTPIRNDGSYRVDGLPAGNYNVLATIPHPQGTALTTGAGAQVIVNQTRTADLSLPATGGVGGFVRRPDKTVAVNLPVQFDGGGLRRSTRTDTGGRYSFLDVYVGAATLETVEQATNTAASTDVIIAPDAVTSQDLLLSVGGTVTGLVRSGNLPVAGAQVTVEWGEGESLTVATDGQGVYRVVRVAPGPVRVRATGGELRGFNAGTLGLSGEILTLNINLYAGGTVTGRVFQAGGVTPVAGATVSINRYVPGLPSSVVTDALGQFTFDAVSIGGFTLDALEPQTGDRGRASNQVSANNETRTVNIVLNGQGRVVVTVRDASSNLITNASVTLHGQTQFGGTQHGTTASDGTVTFAGVFAGQFSVSAVDPATSLGGSASGSVGVGGTTNVTVQLQPAASVLGRVFGPDGVTPVTTGTVRLLYTWYGVARQVAVAGDGSYRFDAVPLGNYILEGLDGLGRVRSRATGVNLTTNGDIVTRNLTFLGIGSVTGIVRRPGGAVGAGLPVSVRSGNAEIGGFFNATTDTDGSYRVTGLLIGTFSAASSDSSQQLLGETTGQITQDGQEVTADIQLLSNGINLPVNRWDVNDFYYRVQGDGAINQGINSVFGGDFNTRQNAWLLDIIAGGTPNRFTGGTVGNTEEGGQEIATRQNGLAGLNVVRKVLISRNGYFARFVETLTNPGLTPITVDVRLQSNLRNYSGNPRVTATSSGDNLVNVGSQTNPDRWVIVDDGADGDPFEVNTTPAVAFVFDGPDAADRADAASLTIPSGQLGQFTHQWNEVTIPPGGSVAFMHFGAQQTSRAAAQATAARLIQLPPEALVGLDAGDISSTRNFAIPADGSSALPAFNLTGSVNGSVFEFDGTTPVPNFTSVRFRSNNLLFARTRFISTQQSNVFSVASLVRPVGQSGSVAVPVEPFSVWANHASTNLQSPTETGSFAAGSTTATQNIRFINASIVRGVVRRHTGVAVTGGTLQLIRTSPSFQSFSVAIASDGSYRAGGLQAGNYTVNALIGHPQGSNLSGSTLVGALTVGQTRTADVLMQATGSLDGTVRNAAGGAAPGVFVRARNNNFSFTRQMSTNAAGQFSLTDVPAGSYTLEAFEPASGIATSRIVTVAQDQTTTQDLTLIGLGTVQVQVNFANGNPAPSAQVNIAETARGGGYRFFGYTDANGALTGQNVSVGAFSVRAYHPGNTQLFSDVPGSIAENGQTVQITAVLPGTGQITGRVTTAGGSPSASTYVDLSGSNIHRAVYTDSNGAYTFTLLPIDRPLTVRAYTSDFAFNRTADGTLNTDGQSRTVDLVLPALATVRVTVLQSGGTPYAGANIYIRDTFSGQRYAGATDSSGILSIPNIPEGSFTVQATSPTTGAFAGSTTDTVEAADHGQTIDVQINAPASVIVTGTIFAADGVTTVPNPYVQVLNVDTGNYLAYGYGTIDGTYRFPDLLVGSGGVTVQAYSPGFDVFVEATKSEQDPAGTIRVDLTLPIGVVRGTVSFSGGSAVPFPNVFVTQVNNGRTYYAQRRNDDGTYEIVGPLAGDLTVTAQDGNTGLTATVDATIVEVATPVVANVALPPTATITGTVRRADNVALPFADVVLRQTGVGFDRYTSTDEDGVYVFEHVRLGNGLLQACDFQTWPYLCRTATAVVDTANQTVTLDLTLPNVGALIGTVFDSDGTTPVQNANVVVENFTNAGPMQNGTYQDASAPNGTYAISNVPEGAVLVTGYDSSYSRAGVADGTVTAGETSTINVTIGNTFNFGTLNLDGADGFRYDVQCQGILNDGGTINRTLNDAYDGAYQLRVESSSFPCVASARLGVGGRLATLGPGTLANLSVQRKIFSPINGGFARFLEVLTNPTAEPITATVEIFSNLGSDGSTRIVVEPSATGNTYAVTDQNGSCCDPALAHVFAGAAAPVGIASTQFVQNNDDARYSWTVTVQPGATAILMHYAVQRGQTDTDGAAAQAQALVALTAADALTGMSALERTQVVNFDVPVEP